MMNTQSYHKRNTRDRPDQRLTFFSSRTEPAHRTQQVSGLDLFNILESIRHGDFSHAFEDTPKICPPGTAYEAHAVYSCNMFFIQEFRTRQIGRPALTGKGTKRLYSDNAVKYVASLPSVMASNDATACETITTCWSVML